MSILLFLSIREAARNVFIAYLARSGSSQTAEAFFEILRKLQANFETPFPSSSAFSSESSSVSSPSSSSTSSSRQLPAMVPPTQLIDAYEAEGLLSLFASVILHVPASVLLQNWSPVLPVLTAYLAHSASTVRQV
jgi:hypothetical protein